jgi:hypothetical protein
LSSLSAIGNSLLNHDVSLVLYAAFVCTFVAYVRLSGLIEDNCFAQALQDFEADIAPDHQGPGEGMTRQSLRATLLKPCNPMGLARL